MSRFDYLRAAPKKKKRRRGEQIGFEEKVEHVYVRRVTHKAVLAALEHQGRDDVGELVEDLLQDWLAAQGRDHV